MSQITIKCGKEMETNKTVLRIEKDSNSFSIKLNPKKDSFPYVKLTSEQVKNLINFLEREKNGCEKSEFL